MKERRQTKLARLTIQLEDTKFPQQKILFKVKKDFYERVKEKETFLKEFPEQNEQRQHFTLSGVKLSV